MADDNKYSFNSDWENEIFRNAFANVASPEALKLFDEEQARLQKEAEDEIRQMIKDGLVEV